MTQPDAGPVPAARVDKGRLGIRAEARTQTSGARLVPVSHAKKNGVRPGASRWRQPFLVPPPSHPLART
ncbi:hypothetical protein C8R44DRAFT_795226, partial [Mycena epipterygia]